MKRSTILFMLLVLSTPLAQAQTPLADLPLARAARAMAPARLALSANVYRPSEVTHLYQQDLNWINETRIRNDFADGLLLQQHHEVWEGHVFGEWQETQVIGYEYTGDRLSATTTFEVGESGLTPLTRTLYGEYGYDPGPWYREITTQIYQDGTWIDEERTTLEVQDGYVTRGTTEAWTGDSWEPTERFALSEEADTYASRVLETYQTWTDAEWVNTERSLYGIPTIAEYYVWADRLMAELSDYEGIYYSLRSLPNVVEQAWDGSAWIDVSRLYSNYTYHTIDGYLIKQESTTSEWTDGAWTPTSRMVIDYVTSSAPYGASGMPEKTTMQIHDGETWLDLFVEKYIHQVWNDGADQRIAQATIEMDLGEGMQETSRTRIEWAVISTDTESPEVAERFVLQQNAPNPFASSTEITFRLAEPQHVRLAVYDLLGREVAELEQGLRAAGEHRVRWDVADAPSGVYLYRLEAGARAETRRMVVVR